MSTPEICYDSAVLCRALSFFTIGTSDEKTLALLNDAAFLSKIMMGLERRSNPSGARDARFQSGEGISGILLRIRMANAFPSRPQSSIPKGICLSWVRIKALMSTPEI